MPLYVGLLSGTSLDSIDAALVRCDDAAVETRHTLSYPFPADLQTQLIELATTPNISPEKLGLVDARLGECFGQAALALLESAGVDPQNVRAIGSHGQTIRHCPQASYPFTWQIGDPNRIAELTCITTVADFRRRDIAAGGQGAPLASALHQAVFRHSREDRAVLNIGGIANLSLLPSDPAQPVTGFDTGPGNLLLDQWHQRHRGGNFDDGGKWAATGQLSQPLLDSFLDDDYFSALPPKTTGREHFNLQWLEERLARFDRLPAEDAQATLSALTARSIARELVRYLPHCQRLLACGGGAHNQKLMTDLQAALPGIIVETTARHGIDPDWVEAVLFAWLAHRALEMLSGNLPSVTGARHPVVLGAIYPGKALPYQ